MLKLKFEIEIDEERLRDIFEENDIKFSKKKVTELKKDIQENDYLDTDVQDYIEERINEIVGEIFGE